MKALPPVPSLQSQVPNLEYMKHSTIQKKKNRFVDTAWKIFVVFIGISMILGMILPFVSLGSS